MSIFKYTVVAYRYANTFAFFGLVAVQVCISYPKSECQSVSIVCEMFLVSWGQIEISYSEFRSYPNIGSPSIPVQQNEQMRFVKE